MLNFISTSLPVLLSIKWIRVWRRKEKTLRKSSDRTYTLPLFPRFIIWAEKATFFFFLLCSRRNTWTECSPQNCCDSLHFHQGRTSCSSPSWLPSCRQWPSWGCPTWKAARRRWCNCLWSQCCGSSSVWKETGRKQWKSPPHSSEQEQSCLCLKWDKHI